MWIYSDDQYIILLLIFSFILETRKIIRIIFIQQVHFFFILTQSVRAQRDRHPKPKGWDNEQWQDSEQWQNVANVHFASSIMDYEPLQAILPSTISANDDHGDDERCLVLTIVKCEVVILYNTHVKCSAPPSPTHLYARIGNLLKCCR